MPGRAFVPGPLGQAQPRVYRAFRGRQIRGLLAAAAGAVTGLLLFGARDAAGYMATFALTVPGFAYGYFQPEGKPVEYWLLVVWRYHFSTQRLGGGRVRSRLAKGIERAALVWRAVRRSSRMRALKEGGTRG